MNFILSAWTVVAFILFVAICLWAWSAHKQEDFESAARIPFDEEREDSEGEINNG